MTIVLTFPDFLVRKAPTLAAFASVAVLFFLFSAVPHRIATVPCSPEVEVEGQRQRQKQREKDGQR